MDDQLTLIDRGFMIKKAVIRYPEYKYRALITRWVDGDTAEFTVYLGSRFDKIDLGFNFRHVIADEYDGVFRMFGINAPEKYKTGGTEATAHASLLAPAGTTVNIMTSKDPDSFGRYIAEIYLENGDTFGESMIAAGHAVIYPEKPLTP